MYTLKQLYMQCTCNNIITFTPMYSIVHAPVAAAMCAAVIPDSLMELTAFWPNSSIIILTQSLWNFLMASIIGV